MIAEIFEGYSEAEEPAGREGAPAVYSGVVRPGVDTSYL